MIKGAGEIARSLVGCTWCSCAQPGLVPSIHMLAHSHVSSVPGGFIWPPDTVCTWYIHILYVFSLKRKSSVAPFSFVNTYCFHVLLGLMVHSRFLILAADLGDLNCSERGSTQTTALRMIELVQNFV